MKTVKARVASACVALAALGVSACVAACKGSTNPGGSEGFGGDDAAGVATGGSSGGAAGSGSSGGSTSTAAPSAPSAEYADGGIACGAQGGCATSEECCYAASTASTASDAGPGAGGIGAFGGGPVAAAPTCTSAGSCTGSSLACSSTQHCSAGQVCCFVYQTSEAGAATGGATGAFGVIAAPMTFSAQCADDCPGGDMIHYQLCASSSDCPSGEQCVLGTYTNYCYDTGAGPGGGTGPQGGDDGGSD